MIYIKKKYRKIKEEEVLQLYERYTVKDQDGNKKQKHKYLFTLYLSDIKYGIYKMLDYSVLDTKCKYQDISKLIISKIDKVASTLTIEGDANDWYFRQTVSA